LNVDWKNIGGEIKRWRDFFETIYGLGCADLKRLTAFGKQSSLIAMNY